MANAILQKLNPLGGGEGGVFGAVFRDGDNDLVKEADSPCEDIQMSQRCGVKRAGIDGAFHQGWIFTQSGERGKGLHCGEPRRSGAGSSDRDG